MKAALGAWAQRHVITLLAIVRNTLPILVYRNKIAVVTRASDVDAVMSDDDTFMVTYAPKMGVVTGGANFFLGMGDTAEYHRDVGNWRAVVRPDDIATIVEPLVQDVALELVAASGGDLDVVADLGAVVPAVLVEHYLGVTGPARQELIDWTTTLFGYLFFPGKPGPRDDEAARVAATTRSHLDDLVATRKAMAAEQRPDDALTRALAMQAQGVDAMSDVDIRNNLLGIAIGAIPTTSKCVALVVDHLLDHPDRLHGMRCAVEDGDWSLANGYVDEALRFNPFGPVLLRTCTADHRLAAGTLRSRTIKQGTTVAVSTLSAMWDGRSVPDPKRFDPNRPTETYRTYGQGMHTCFGARINAVQIARIVGAVIVRDGLRRAEGADGRMQLEGPFPTHLRVTFDHGVDPASDQKAS